MDAFTLFLDYLSLIGSGILQIWFVDALAGMRTRIGSVAVYLAALVALQELGSYLDMGVSIIFVQVIVLWCVSRWINRHANAVAWIGAILAIYITQLAFGLLNSIGTLLLPMVLTTPMFAWLRLGMGIAELVAAAFGYAVLLRCLKFKNAEYLPYAALVAFPGLFFLGIQVYIQRTSYMTAVSSLTASETAQHMVLFTLQGLGLGALICTLLAYRRVLEDVDAQKALASFKQAAHMQRIYVEEAQKRYEKTRAFRHDIRNHLIVLEGLLQQGDAETAREYLEQMELKSGELSLPVHTGNGVVDILLAEKLSQADGIRIDLDVQLPTGGGVEDFDWCVLFSNALDNAIRACRQAGEDQWISILGKRQGAYYLLEFENRCPEGPLPMPGIGLENIRTAAERHGGSMLVEKRGSLFSLSILLDISGSGGDISKQDA